MKTVQLWKAKFIERVRAGRTPSTVAAAMQVGLDLYYREMRRDPDFKKGIETAVQDSTARRERVGVTRASGAGLI